MSKGGCNTLYTALASPCTFLEVEYDKLESFYGHDSGCVLFSSRTLDKEVH